MRDFLLGTLTRCVPFGSVALVSFRQKANFAERMFGIVALVDVGGDFAPAVERLHGVVAALDLRELDERAALLVDGHPGLTVDDVEIRIGPVDAARLAVDDLVPLEPFLEIKVFLPQHQPAAEHVFVSLDNVPVGDAAGGLRVSRRYNG